jgi:hypothetical protein
MIQLDTLKRELNQTKNVETKQLFEKKIFLFEKEITQKQKQKIEIKKELGIERFLPPGRYHYDEETRLNAISILVSSKDTEDFNLIEEGIKNLGKMEIHSALQALSSLDLASDELIYNMIAKYYNLESLEYRIYCAWLLRKRYGEIPAKYLTDLLLDHSRISRYTYSLFEERLLEKELIISILTTIKEREINSRGLIIFLELLRKTNQFYSEEIVESYGQQIVSTLMKLCSHSQNSIRLEAYRTLLSYQELI